MIEHMWQINAKPKMIICFYVAAVINLSHDTFEFLFNFFMLHLKDLTIKGSKNTTDWRIQKNEHAFVGRWTLMPER